MSNWIVVPLAIPAWETGRGIFSSFGIQVWLDKQEAAWYIVLAFSKTVRAGYNTHIV